jgi:hypothetical protein
MDPSQCRAVVSDPAHYTHSIQYMSPRTREHLRELELKLQISNELCASPNLSTINAVEFWDLSYKHGSLSTIHQDRKAHKQFKLLKESLSTEQRVWRKLVKIPIRTTVLKRKLMIDYVILIHDRCFEHRSPQFDKDSTLLYQVILLTEIYSRYMDQPDMELFVAVACYKSICMNNNIDILNYSDLFSLSNVLSVEHKMKQLGFHSDGLTLWSTTDYIFLLGKIMDLHSDSIDIAMSLAQRWMYEHGTTDYRPSNIAIAIIHHILDNPKLESYNNCLIIIGTPSSLDQTIHIKLNKLIEKDLILSILND